jgi:hypothetical protein
MMEKRLLNVKVEIKTVSRFVNNLYYRLPPFEFLPPHATTPLGLLTFQVLS